MDDTRTRDPRAGRPRPELPESLAWLYDPPPEDLVPERGPFEPQADPEPPVARDQPPADDPQALPTLLPFSASDAPAPNPYAGPVRGLRSAFARLEGARPEGAPAVPAVPADPASDGEEFAADRRDTGSTGWDIPVVRPFAPAPLPADDEADEPWHDDDREDEAPADPIGEPVDEPVGAALGEALAEALATTPADLEAAPEPALNLFEPVALEVPPEPPAHPSPLPTWNAPAPWPSAHAPQEAPPEEPLLVAEAVSYEDGDEDDEDGEDGERVPAPLPVRPRLASLVSRTAPPEPPAPVAQVDEEPDVPATQEPAARAEPPAPPARPRLAGLLSRPAPAEPPAPTAKAGEPDAEEPATPDDVAEVVDAQDDPASAEAPLQDALPGPVQDVEQDVERESVQEPVQEREPERAPPEALEIPPRPGLADPALMPLWSAVRDALGVSARHTAPAVDVRGLDQAGRRALAGLLGVPAVRAATRVDLADLGRIVEEVAGLPLIAAAERFVPVTGRRVRAQSRTAPVRAGQEWLEVHPELAAQPWTGTWLETVRRDLVGGDTGLTENEVVAALEVLRALATSPAPNATPWRLRQELAAEVAGDEHALDEGSAIAALVLRGLAASAGTVVPGDAAARRRLWARSGVLTDLVSTTCAAVGVAPASTEPAGEGACEQADRWRRAAREGVPVHVTARDLRLGPDAWVAVADAWPAVLVVTSPLLLDAVADRFAGRVGAVCTDGAPGPVALDLLARLSVGGVPLRFLADFDQAGVAVGAQLVERLGAAPWRMSAEVYRQSVRSDLPPLGGRLDEVPWAPGLAAAMAQAGRSVPVEQLLDEVLADLEVELATPSGTDDRPEGH